MNAIKPILSWKILNKNFEQVSKYFSKEDDKIIQDLAGVQNVLSELGNSYEKLLNDSFSQRNDGYLKVSFGNVTFYQGGLHLINLVKKRYPLLPIQVKLVEMRSQEAFEISDLDLALTGTYFPYQTDKRVFENVKKFGYFISKRTRKDDSKNKTTL